MGIKKASFGDDGALCWHSNALLLTEIVRAANFIN
jgi:hypothetical protein